MMRTVVLLLTVMTYPAIAQACEPGWETFPDGQTNTTYAVIEHEGVVYRGGWFSLFRWTESYWQTFGGGIGGDLANLFAGAFSTYPGQDDLLVIGGRFPEAGGLTVNSIATWDGVQFGPVGAGVDGEIRALAIYKGDLIAAGRFDIAGGVPAHNIARWDGSEWHTLGAGVYDAVWDGTVDGAIDMVVWGDELYVAGDFTHAGETQVNYVARWDGTTWSDVGGGISVYGGGPTGLRGVDVHGDQLVVVGYLHLAGGVETSNIAGWNGEEWSAFGEGADRNGQASLSVASYKGLLYVGGDFTDTAGSAAQALAVWDGESWQAVDDGLSGGEFFGPSVYDMSIAGEGETASLLMGGSFDSANGEPTDQVARYTYCEEPSNVVWPDPRTQPLKLRLFPNPATAGASYAIQLSEAAHVRVSLVDAAGRHVDELWDRSLAPGVHQFNLDMNRDRLPRGGVHYLRVVADGRSVTGKVVLVP